MIKMKKLLLFLPVLLVVLMTGCLKDDQDQSTIVLLGTESDVKPIEEVIPDTLLSFLKTVSPELTLPTGNTPPDIQGEFVFAPRELYANNGHLLPANDTIRFRFGGDSEPLEITSEIQLHSGDTIFYGADTLVLHADSLLTITGMTLYYPEGQHNGLVPCDILEDGLSLQKGIEAYVMGTGNQFTVYFVVTYDDCEEPNSGVKFSLTRGYVLTGTMTEDGIDRAVMACVNIAVQAQTTSPNVPGSSLQDMLDKIYVYRVNSGNPINPFGMAVRKNWY